ncbi:Chloroplast 30S ribosomal protein S10 [Musa troglodytarum]|uniref:Small ribosomal subunit protein uS10c n=1 Tax=Musa troglodytarum TaxID=320322 RepID=A0A9E7JW91_9LILI|nr:Chloroplast 30S ribosomal protein S10 [Musa troglodytarum]
MAASSSLSATLALPSLSNRASLYPKPRCLSFSPQCSNPLISLRSRAHSSPRVPAAAAEAVGAVQTPDAAGASIGFEVEDKSAVALDVDADADKMAPKQKIRIKLRSYWVSLIEDSCKQILEAARTTNAKTMGPVPLPTKRRVYCVLKSPHVHKDSRFHFEIRTHQRLIDILHPTAQTIDSLMQLDLPAGVDVEVKL